MYSLDEILRICDKKSMINGNLKYIDNIPYTTNDIGENNYNYYIMKYYEGSISVEEHEKIKNNLYIGQIYNKYIFNPVDIFNSEFTICDEDVDDIIYLRMAVSKDSKYLEILNKLMLRIYFEKKKIELSGLVQKIYEQYSWVKAYMDKQKENKLSLIFQDNIEEYNQYFGIDISKIGIQDNANPKNFIEKTEKISKENNWILQKFGG